MNSLIEFRRSILRVERTDQLSTEYVVWNADKNKNYFVCVLEGENGKPLFTTVTKKPVQRYYDFFLFGQFIDDEFRLLLLELALSKSPPKLRVVASYQSRIEALTKELEINQNYLHSGIRTFNKKPINEEINNNFELNLIKANDKGAIACKLGCTSFDNPYTRKSYREAWEKGFTESSSK